MDGFYSAHMTGSEGQGFALFVFRAGTIVGADPLGVSFDGSYEISSDQTQISGSVTVRVPPNGLVIQGLTTGPDGLVYSVLLDFPVDFGSLPFVRVETPLGPINLRLRKIRTLATNDG